MPDQERDIFAGLDQRLEEQKVAEGLREEHAAYREKIAALQQKMSEYYRMTREGVKLLDAAAVAEIMQFYQDAAKAGETYLEKIAAQRQPGEPEPPVAGILRQVSGVLAKDMDALRQYDQYLKKPAEMKEVKQRVKEKNGKVHTRTKQVPVEKTLRSLPTLVEMARMRTINLKDTSIQRKGGALSQRIPLSFIDSEGKTVKGYLTKRSDLETDAVKAYDSLLQSTKALAQGEKAELMCSVLDQFLDAYARRSGLDPANREEVIQSMTAEFAHAVLGNGNPNVLMSEMLTECGLSVTEEQELKKHQMVVLQSFGKALSSISITPEMYELAGVKNHARIDERNAAMSTTAELLGVSGVLCRSQTVRCVDEQGKLVEGTFMADAGGENPNDPSPKCAMLDGDDPLGNSKGCFKQIADLQALDFICGNVDRHDGNFSFQMSNDKPPQVLGIKGFDNDTSFGDLVPTNGRKVNHMVGLDYMKAMSRSMAEKIKALDAETLKVSLRQYGLRESELDAAAKRLELMKRAITKGERYFANKRIESTPTKRGYIRIVEDDEWQKLKLSDLKTNYKPWFKPRQTNLFTYAEQHLRILKQDAAKKLENQQKNAAPKNARLVTHADRADPTAMKEIQMQFTVMAAPFLQGDDLPPVKEGESAELTAQRAFREQLIKYAEFHQELDERLNQKPMTEKELTAAANKRQEAANGKPVDDIKTELRLEEKMRLAFDTRIGMRDINLMDRHLLSLQEATENYMQALNQAGKTEEAKRLAEFNTYVADSMRRSPDEDATIKANERAGLEEFNRSAAQLADRLAGVKQQPKQPKQQSMK